MKIWVYRGIFRRRRRRKKILPLSTRYFGIFFGSEGGGLGQQDFGPRGGVRAAGSRTESGLNHPCAEGAAKIFGYFSNVAIDKPEVFELTRTF